MWNVAFNFTRNVIIFPLNIRCRRLAYRRIRPICHDYITILWVNILPFCVHKNHEKNWKKNVDVGIIVNISKKVNDHNEKNSENFPDSRLQSLQMHSKLKYPIEF